MGCCIEKSRQVLHRRLVSLPALWAATGIECRIFHECASQRVRPCRRSLLCRTACLVRSSSASLSLLSFRSSLGGRRTILQVPVIYARHTVNL
jgi:hypothetical protein